jgi:hypothetical protein
VILRRENNRTYLAELPSVAGVVAARLLSGVELLGLKKGKKKWTTGNIELRHSLPIIIYSPYSGRYWYRILERDHDITPLRRYIRDGNIWIHFTDYWQGVIKEEREAEGLPYYKYNKIRELILMREILEKRDDKGDLKTKLRAIDITINNLKQET